MVIHNNFRIGLSVDASFKFLPYQLWMVGYWPTMTLTGNSWGYSYSIVRGEILGFMEDELLRKHLPRMFSLIKNES